MTCLYFEQAFLAERLYSLDGGAAARSFAVNQYKS